MVILMLAFCVSMVAGDTCAGMPYVRPPASSSRVREQILAVKKSATDPDQVLPLISFL